MSHGELQRKDWKNLVTVRPGPVLHVWRSGKDGAFFVYAVTA